MAKKSATESDETKLKTKVQGRRKDHAKDPALRMLLKRLKRTQRKRRALAARKRRAAGKQVETKAEAPTGA